VTARVSGQRTTRHKRSQMLCSRERRRLRKLPPCSRSHRTPKCCPWDRLDKRSGQPGFQGFDTVSTTHLWEFFAATSTCRSIMIHVCKTLQKEGQARKSQIGGSIDRVVGEIGDDNNIRHLYMSSSFSREESQRGVRFETPV